MMIVSLILLLLFARLSFVRRAVRRLRLAGRMQGEQCDAPDRISVSLLLAEGVDPEQLLHLLSVEYACYEVVVVLDRLREQTLFDLLVERYHLIRVEYLPTGDLPVEGVVGLYRSRKRRFRRLVLLDQCVGDRTARRNAAADVAAGDYLLLVGCGDRLAEGVIERLAALLASEPQPSPLLRSTVGVRTLLCAREALVRAGGFAHYPRRFAGRLLHAPILVRAEPRRSALRRLLPLLLLGVAVGVGVVTAYFGILAAVLVVTLLLLLLLAAVRIGQMTRS
ncbi:MAG: hypothetical protein IKZ12_03530 [Alistipes sp.]|nr:hypothetical protein [Alistipes sp.]